MLLAQTTQPVTGIPWLASVAGIVVATLIVVEIVKKLIPTGNVLAQVPIWAWSVGVSCGLTILAHQVTHTLEGDLATLTWLAVSGAATASGFYSWLRNTTAGTDAAGDLKIAKGK